MRAVSAELAAAVAAAERTVRVRLSVDWDADGHGPPGSLDDLSGKAARLTVASVLQGTQPEQANVVEVTAAATLDVDLAAGDTDDERLQAVRYFAPTSTTSPLAGKDRVGRNVEVDVELLTAAGWQAVPLLRGTSRALPVRVADRQANLAGLDYRTRLRTPVALPAMAADVPFNGVLAPNKPGLEGTWVVSFVLYQCGFPMSPPPPAGCRLFMPMHGSAMPFVGRPFVGSPVAYRSQVGSGGSPASPLMAWTFDTGPFLLATARPDIVAPYIAETSSFAAQPADGPAMVDGNGRSNGRVTAWVRTTGQVLTFNTINDADGSNGTTWNVTTGVLELRNGGSTRTVQGPTPPFDGGWHLVGVQWDDAAGRADFCVDGRVATVPFATTTADPGSVDGFLTFGDTSAPLAELQLSCGLAFTVPWPVSQYTPPATVDRSALRLDGIVAAPPDEGWAILSELAQAEQGALYVDPDGRPHYATRARLVSTAAQTVQRTVDATTDMFDLAMDVDLARVANIVACGWQPVTVASQSPAWQLRETVVVFAGQTVTLVAEVSGLATSQRSIFGHVNTASNGAGTQTSIGSGFANAFPVTLDFISDTAALVTVNNTTSVPVWVVNTSGQPDLTITGDVISQTTAGDLATVTDEPSRGRYDDQPVTLPSNRWVQSKAFAAGLAMATVGDLASPQPVFGEVPMPGDPRLEYFDRLRLTDPTNTQLAMDVWYVGGAHRVDPAGYEQTLACRPARDRFLAGAGLAGVDLVG